MTGRGVEVGGSLWYDTKSPRGQMLIMPRLEEPIMVKPINLSESHELRDAAGNVVGYLLPVKEFEARLESANGAMAESSRPSASEEKCQHLTEECARLRAQLEEVQRERRDYLRALGALLLKDEPVPSKAEIFASLGQGPPWEELINQLEAELIAKESGRV